MAGSYYEVEVRPSAAGWSTRLEAQLGPQMKLFAEQIERQLREAVRDGLSGANLPPIQNNPRVRQQGQQQGRQFADAFERELKTKLERAMNSLPAGNARLLINGSQAERELAKVRQDLQRITDANIGVDLSDAEARAKVDALRERLARLATDSPEVRVRINAGAALAEVEKLRAELDRLDGRNVTVDAKVKVDRTADLKLLQSASALAPAAIPLAAGLAGLAAQATAVAGVAGLAILGIKNKADAASTDMVQGQLNALQPLYKEWTRLAAIQAAPGITAGLRAIQAVGPQVNLLVEQLGHSVGTVVEGLGIGLPKALKVIGPLLADAAEGADKLGGFLAAGPSENGGLVKTVGYINQAMPQAVAFLDHLVETLGHVVEAAAPVGSVTLDIIDGFLQLVSVIPTPALTALVALYSTYRLAAFSAALATKAFGASVGATVGPIAAAIAAVTALTIAANNAQSGSNRGLSGVAAAARNGVKGDVSAQARINEGADPTDTGAGSLLFNGGGGLKVINSLLGRSGGIEEAKGNALILQATIKSMVPPAQDLGTALAKIDIKRALGSTDLSGDIVATGNGFRTLSASLTDYLATASQLDGVGSGQQVTINGVTYAQDEYSAALKQSNGNTAQAVALMERNRSTAQTLQTQIDNVTTQQTTLNDAVGDAAAKFGISTDMVSQYAAAVGITGLEVATGTVSSLELSRVVGQVADSLRNANEANQAWLDAVKQFTPATATAADTASLLAAALDATRGDALSYTSTMLGADQATQQVAKSIHDNLGSIAADGSLLGASYVDAGGKFIEASTKFTDGSVAISGGLQQQISAATSAAAATYQHESALYGSERAAQDAMTVYAGYRQSLIDQADQSGLTAAQAQGLADKYFAMPTDVDTFVKMLGEGDVTTAIVNLTTALNNLSGKIATPGVSVRDNASAQIDSIGRKLVNLNGNSATVYVQTAGGKAALSAYGNIFDTVGHYAAGGITDGLSAKMSASAARFARGAENHVPQIAMPNGGMRIWAEPETQGEAYIPFALDRRARAEDIVSQVASRFGGTYLPRQAATSTPLSAVGSASMGGTGSDGLVREVAALRADVQTVTSAVLHTADRYDGAVDKTARTVGLASQQQPRRG